MYRQFSWWRSRASGSRRMRFEHNFPPSVYVFFVDVPQEWREFGKVLHVLNEVHGWIHRIAFNAHSQQRTRDGYLIRRRSDADPECVFSRGRRRADQQVCAIARSKGEAGIDFSDLYIVVPLKLDAVLGYLPPIHARAGRAAWLSIALAREVIKSNDVTIRTIYNPPHLHLARTHLDHRLQASINRQRSGHQWILVRTEHIQRCLQLL